MNVWDGPSDGPGSDDSLMLLYYLVPVTEEIDLLDQHDRAQAQAENERYLQEVIRFDVEQEVPDEPAWDEAFAEELVLEPRLTDRQVFGVLHELLGAEIIDEAEDFDGNPTP